MEQHPNSRAAPAPSAASLEADLNRAPAADNALVPHAQTPPPAAPGDLGASADPGVDLAAYQWVPVLRKPRKDGWTPQRQVEFIAALADTGCVEEAAVSAGMTANSCYRLRRSPGSEDFARAWDVAVAHAARRLVDVAFDRAIHGSDEPVYDKRGNRVGRRMRQNDRLLMFLLRAYMPERFRHAHRDMRAPDETLPPPPEPLGQALDRLDAPAPAKPHLLMAPEELGSALQFADFLDGALPRWHRGKGDAEPAPEDPSEPEPGPEDWEEEGDGEDASPFLD
jgi:hypothetical protein